MSSVIFFHGGTQIITIPGHGGNTYEHTWEELDPGQYSSVRVVAVMNDGSEPLRSELVNFHVKEDGAPTGIEITSPVADQV